MSFVATLASHLAVVSPREPTDLFAVRSQFLQLFTFTSTHLHRRAVESLLTHRASSKSFSTTSGRGSKDATFYPAGSHSAHPSDRSRQRSGAERDHIAKRRRTL